MKCKNTRKRKRLLRGKEPGNNHLFVKSEETNLVLAEADSSIKSATADKSNFRLTSNIKS
jgi:hypothetical protein